MSLAEWLSENFELVVVSILTMNALSVLAFFLFTGEKK